jgi:hypothetical protein
LGIAMEGGAVWNKEDALFTGESKLKPFPGHLLGFIVYSCLFPKDQNEDITSDRRLQRHTPHIGVELASNIILPPLLSSPPMLSALQSSWDIEGRLL